MVGRGAVPVEVGEHLLHVHHQRLDALADVEQHRVAAFLAQLAADVLDDRVARVADGVNRVAEADDDFLALDAGADVGLGFVGAGITRDDVHGHFVGAAVLGTTQRADGAGEAAEHVAAGTGDDAGGEGGRVELMFGVEHQRLVQGLGMRGARRLAVQQVQEVAGDGVVVGLDVDAAAVAGEVPPVQQHRTKAGHQAVGDVAGLGHRVAFALGQHRAQHRTARAHHVHRMRIGRHQLQRVGDDGRQAAQAPELGLVGSQLGGGGQRAVHQQVGDFLEAGLGRQVLDVVTTVMQVVAAAADGAQGGVAGGRAAQGHRLLRLGQGVVVAHAGLLAQSFCCENSSSSLSS